MPAKTIYTYKGAQYTVCQLHSMRADKNMSIAMLKYYLAKLKKSDNLNDKTLFELLSQQKYTDRDTDRLWGEGSYWSTSTWGLPKCNMKPVLHNEPVRYC